MSMRLPTSRGRKVQVDTSLAIVNIVLLLIFYFLLAGQDSKVRTQLELATTTTLSPDTLPSPVLEVLGPEDWRLNGQPIRPEALPGALAASPGPVHLLLDRNAPAGLLVGLMRRPELAGHELRLVTIKGLGG
ncbi:ExbD/TolR family protein [Paracoccus lutimaris]|uniref:Outer membrane transport energization protein ExbD n=1 Tax=Paracoccus lutimaris TaxID=1490030 RepID=A0A368Z6B7_9RHOB|nr:biopolymer transporter ExbD [Paracoccus lutimaris]RCW87046.1 outer membrane transport energization protein ExbD [Paracoccus lutimaris]